MSWSSMENDEKIIVKRSAFRADPKRYVRERGTTIVIDDVTGEAVFVISVPKEKPQEYVYKVRNPKTGKWLYRLGWGAEQDRWCSRGGKLIKGRNEAWKQSRNGKYEVVCYALEAVT